ncbi:hypothetical protein GCM10010123_39480 [Pilimelia anulata]|uniref:Tox-PL domain-containing protein n=1 Tax=Pilimelia anulata TaxID=53371 RepID=A0A8J3BA46_9ACTN|nr:toxin glutamine deamidase domain-containing protein [Pilimelia anulata]GGK05642.1 hypothetical protein GCM10010123_39480 [Pilimelia anulata]
MTGLPRPLPDPADWAWGEPPWITTAVAAAAERWPRVDERRLFDLADQWFALALALHEPRDDAARAGERLLDLIGDGAAAEAARTGWARLVDGAPGPLDSVPEEAHRLGTWAESAGCAAEAAKLTAWEHLADLAADLVVVDLASALTDGAAAPVAEVLVAAAGERIGAIVDVLAATLAETVPAGGVPLPATHALPSAAFPAGFAADAFPPDAELAAFPAAADPRPDAGTPALGSVGPGAGVLAVGAAGAARPGPAAAGDAPAAGGRESGGGGPAGAPGGGRDGATQLTDTATQLTDAATTQLTDTASRLTDAAAHSPDAGVPTAVTPAPATSTPAAESGPVADRDRAAGGVRPVPAEQLRPADDAGGAADGPARVPATAGSVPAPRTGTEDPGGSTLPAASRWLSGIRRAGRGRGPATPSTPDTDHHVADPHVADPHGGDPHGGDPHGAGPRSPGHPGADPRAVVPPGGGSGGPRLRLADSARVRPAAAPESPAGAPAPSDPTAVRDTAGPSGDPRPTGAATAAPRAGTAAPRDRAAAPAGRAAGFPVPPAPDAPSTGRPAPDDSPTAHPAPDGSPTGLPAPVGAPAARADGGIRPAPAGAPAAAPAPAARRAPDGAAALRPAPAAPDVQPDRLPQFGTPPAGTPRVRTAPDPGRPHTEPPENHTPGARPPGDRPAGGHIPGDHTPDDHAPGDHHAGDRPPGDHPADAPPAEHPPGSASRRPAADPADAAPPAAPAPTRPVVADDDSPVTRTRRYDAPGGHHRPPAAHQDAVDRAVPRAPDGTPLRHADPRTAGYLPLLNPWIPGAADPTRLTNATDCALAFFDTWARGRPRVAAGRVRDGYRTGDPLGAGTPDDGPARIAAVAGGAFQNLCPLVTGATVEAARAAVNHALRNLHMHLRALGPGAFAFLVHGWEGGNAHTWVAANQDHAILYVDPLVGQLAEAPLYGHYGRPYDGNVVVLDALVVGPDGTPRPLPQHPPGLLAAPAGPAPQPPAPPAEPAPEPPAEPDLDLLMLDAPELAAAIVAGTGVRDALRAESSAVAMLWCVRGELAAGECTGGAPAAEAVQPGFDPARRHDPAYAGEFLDRLLAAAPAARAELAELAARAAGGRAPVAAAAAPDRDAAAALVRGWHGDAARLVELAGVRVEAPDPAALRAVRDAVRADPAAVVLAVEDGLDGQVPGGYPDVRLTVRTGAGHVGVIRLCLRDVVRADRYGEALSRLRARIAADPGGDSPARELVVDGLARLRREVFAATDPAGRAGERGGPRYYRWRLVPVKVVDGVGWRLAPGTGGWEPLPAPALAALAGERDPLTRRLDRAAFVQEVEAERARLLRGVGPAAALYAVARAIRQRAAAADRPLTAEERGWVVGIARRTYALTEADLADRAQPGADPRPEVADTL